MQIPSYVRAKCWERKGQRDTSFPGELGTFAEDVNFELSLKCAWTFSRYEWERGHLQQRDPHVKGPELSVKGIYGPSYGSSNSLSTSLL